MIATAAAGASSVAPPKLKKLIRLTNLAGNDLILEQVHEAIRVRREASTLKERTARVDTQVD